MTLQGYGRLLMEEAEHIARVEHRSQKLAVISGVGTRHYYRKLGLTKFFLYVSWAATLLSIACVVFVLAIILSFFFIFFFFIFFV